VALWIGLISTLGGLDSSYEGHPVTTLKGCVAELSRRLGISRGEAAQHLAAP
jgi:hypothetical protein